MSDNEAPRGGALLPEVADDTLARIETRVFDSIARERREARSGARRRRRVWQGAGAAAAIVAVAAVISPAVLQGIGGPSSTGGGDAAMVREGVEPGGADGGARPEAPHVATDESAGSGSGQALPGQTGEAAREVLRTGSATIVVDDVTAAAGEVAALASEFDGWVESLSIGEDAAVPMDDGTTTEYIPVPPGDGWVSIRVPAADLDAAMARLGDIGEVTGTRVGSEDVSTATRDLRARIDAARASVQRLTELLGQSGSVSDLVAVEGQLSERQAELESLEQQLEHYESQVAMSSLSVTLTAQGPRVEPDPAGFGDGLEAGWNGLLATLNGIVVALGFLLPWLAVLGLAWLTVRAVLRATRGRRRRAATRETASADIPE